MKVLGWRVSLATDHQEPEGIKARYKEDQSALVGSANAHSQKSEGWTKPSQKTLLLTGSVPTSKARTALASVFCSQNTALFQAWSRAGHNPSWPLHAKLFHHGASWSSLHMTVPQTLEYIVKYLLYAWLCVILRLHQSPFPPGEVPSLRVQLD